MASDVKTVTINGEAYEFETQKSILNFAADHGIYIPTLCYFWEISPTGACRMCLVEVEGQPRPVPACSTAITDGMKIITNSPKIERIRRTLLELLVANHPLDCLYCVRNNDCELQTLASMYGVRDHRYLGEQRSNQLDMTSVAVVRDPNKCILCGRCVKVCSEIQTVSAIDFTKRGFKTIVSSAFNKTIDESTCVCCGQCVRVCPTGALKEKSAQAEVIDNLTNKTIHTVVQVAPSISVTIGEECGLPPGTDMSGKIVTALKRVGFEAVFDTVFGADLTIMEEAHELVDRIQQNRDLPMISTCSPGWIKFMEQFFPDLIPHMSTCKSPMSMEGAIIKSFWAQNKGYDPKSIYQVAIMPCMAKKFEAARPELVNDGIVNTDAVLTTRELIRMLRKTGMDLEKLPESPYDDPLAESTGAGKLFGTTGGVMEAALRTAYWMVNGENLENLAIESVRGLKGIKKATVQLSPDLEVNCVAVSGLGNARKICEEIQNGNPNNYQFIEIMACPGGCINGGGQPRGIKQEIIEARMKALYTLDDNYAVRTSHENQSVKALYDNYLKELGSEAAHHLLHTKYYPRTEDI